MPRERVSLLTLFSSRMTRPGTHLRLCCLFIGPDFRDFQLNAQRAMNGVGKGIEGLGKGLAGFFDGIGRGIMGAFQQGGTKPPTPVASR